MTPLQAASNPKRPAKRSRFDRPVNRRGTASVKWAHAEDCDVIPMWVADMDFQSPPAVVAALRARVAHGVFGYTLPPRRAVDAVLAFHEREHGWKVDPSWLVWLPGLVPALNMVCRMQANGPASPIATFTPVYPPFLRAPANAGRPLCCLPMNGTGEFYTLEPDAPSRATAAGARTILFCNPQNPTGRVFSRAELELFAEHCLRSGLTICSDEIHSGLVLDADKPHIPLATLSDEVARRTITLMSAAKTFNTPGLSCAYAIVPDPELRRDFRRTGDDVVPHVNALGYTALTACYNSGERWHRELIVYLRGNRDRVEEAVRALPAVTMKHVEGTYLAWVDVRAAIRDDPRGTFLAHGVEISDGAEFGAPGFVRLNFGCPRSLLDEGLKRFAAGVAASVADA